MIEFFQTNKTLLLAILSGIVPAIFWLWFWLHQEDQEKPEPLGLIIISFILGGLTVFIAIWLEKYSLNFIKDKTSNNSLGDNRRIDQIFRSYGYYI